MWVPPFGHPWIYAYLQLPAAFRSLSRPSSAYSAWASALRPFSLDLCFADSFGLLTSASFCGRLTRTSLSVEVSLDTSHCYLVLLSFDNADVFLSFACFTVYAVFKVRPRDCFSV